MAPDDAPPPAQAGGPPFAPAYPLLTERLRLRPFASDDLETVAGYYLLPEVHRYLYTEPGTREHLASTLASWARMTAISRSGDSLKLAVVRRDGGGPIGDVSLEWHSGVDRKAEVGYVFDPAHGGQGFATEAARLMVGLAFDRLGAHRVIGRCDGRNLASARVLERLGMRREAHLIENEWVKDEWTDEVVYAILDREWRALAGAQRSPEP